MSIPIDQAEPVKGLGHLAPIDGRREGLLRLPGHPEPYALIADPAPDDPAECPLVVRCGTRVVGRCLMQSAAVVRGRFAKLQCRITIFGFPWDAEISRPSKGRWEITLEVAA